MAVMLSGLEHSLAPIALREALSFTNARTADLDRAIAALPGVEGCVILSTCNRTELYLSGREGLDPGRILCAAAGVDHRDFAGAMFTCSGETAVRHLTEVAAGLRSRVWGEDQIVSQVKRAIALARESGTADSVLETLFRTAVSAGKEVRSQVRLTALPTSAAARAVELLQQTAGSLEGKRALVIGNGEMGRLAAALLREAGCAVTVTLRSYHHGETVVPAGCSAAPYEDRFALMEESDLLLSATTSPHYTVSVDSVASLRRLPALMADLAIPRDIQPLVGELPGVTLFNVDDLEEAGPSHLVPPQVEEILERHQDQFYRWLNYKGCMPVLEELKAAIVERVFTSRELSGDLEPEELVELAVSRSVELLAGGLADSISPESLTRCGRKIRAHTTGRPLLGREA